MATGQYLADLALALVQRGHEVTVVTSRRAYDDPNRIFSKEETWDGVRVIRVGSTGFGKGAKWRRALDFASFLAACVLRLARLPRSDVVVALTSPPLISFIGAWLARLRGSRFVYWVMDFNPDEAIAAGWLRHGSPAARVLEAMSRFSLRQADRIVALDRFMAGRIAAKGIAAQKVAVIPPWWQEGQVRFDAAGRERFRNAHELKGKFVVMYSGNHSPCHPLDTLLEAAQRLATEEDIVFCFVGGGSEWRKIKEKDKDRRMRDEGNHESQTTPILQYSNTPSLHLPITPPLHNSNSPSPPSLQPPRLLCLPYQSLSELSASLSAADLHVVVMGDPFVGLVHPCKIYNILAVGAPVLYIGPKPSHVTDMKSANYANYAKPTNCMNHTNYVNGKNWMGVAGHGEADRVTEIIRQAREARRMIERETIAALAQRFSREKVLPELIAVLEGKHTNLIVNG